MSPVTPGALERRRSRSREEILTAAWALCQEQGLAQLSLRELAGRVGLRAPSLYSYFDSKDAIYDAMFAQGQRELADHMADSFSRAEDRDDLRRSARDFFIFCTADPVRYQLLFQRVLADFVPSDESYALAVAHLQRMGARMGALGVTEPRHLDLWTAIITGLTDQQISNDPGGDRWARLLDEAVDLFCDHVGIEP